MIVHERDSFNRIALITNADLNHSMFYESISREFANSSNIKAYEASKLTTENFSELGITKNKQGNYPDYRGRIFQVQMKEIIEKWGGALNCSTWTISEDKKLQ